ncbi:MAG: hypothetical protein EBX92_09125 [Actinobacteria bacterium]|nr:hypothetical protein [Actinomycetota bacterium]
MTTSATSRAIAWIGERLELDSTFTASLRNLRPSLIDALPHSDSGTLSDLGWCDDDGDPAEDFRAGKMVIFDRSPMVALDITSDEVRIWKVGLQWCGPGHNHMFTFGHPIIEMSSEHRPSGSTDVLEAIAEQRCNLLREATFCMYCAELVMPYLCDETHCCMSCSEKILGVVH